MEVEAEFKGKVFKVWISEVLGGWSPKFAKDNSVFVNVPEEEMDEDEEESRPAESNEGDGLGDNNATESRDGGNNTGGNFPVEKSPVDQNVESENANGAGEGTTHGEEEIVNVNNKFGGNWKEIFAECIINEETRAILSQRNNEKDSNETDTWRTITMSSFQANPNKSETGNKFGPEVGSGPEI
ncbi:hypothetical protein Hanom_Chr04g00304561 [Helianthus anomalus]